jgi:Multiubiquitin
MADGNQGSGGGGNQGPGGNEGPGGKGGPGGNQGPGGPGGGDPHKFHIQIDRAKYEVTKSVMTGAELRAVPPGGIAADRDLFEVVPSEPDKKIGDNDPVEIRNGKRFFTAPGQINPGVP